MPGFEERALHQWLAGALLRRMRTAIGPRVVNSCSRLAPAIERAPSGRLGPANIPSQDMGQFFAVAKWRFSGKLPTNQQGSLLKAQAKRSKFVQCTLTA
jgi:hypothetical protein